MAHNMKHYRQARERAAILLAAMRDAGPDGMTTAQIQERAKLERAGRTLAAMWERGEVWGRDGFWFIGKPPG